LENSPRPINAGALEKFRKEEGKFGVVFGRLLRYNISIRKSIAAVRKEKR